MGTICLKKKTCLLIGKINSPNDASMGCSFGLNRDL
jgi:hypothetical protein